MSQNRNLISKQVLAWTAVFALVLSILPYSVADQTSDEYFESWSYELSDTDGDNQDDTVIFTFDVDTNVSDYAEVEVNMNVIDANGNYVGGENEDYEIYWTENDTFQMEWFVDDCYEEDDDGCEAPYDFSFTLYEIDDNGYYYYEDNFSEADIWLNETTIIPEGVMQIENAVLADDIDGYHNDILFFAHMEDYEISNVTIELERKVGTQWVDVGDEDTDEDGEASFKNMSSGEYRWSGTYDGETIDALSHTFVFYGPTSGQNMGHVAVAGDYDNDGDFDDFGFARLHGNSSEPEFNDGVYVELLYEGNNTLYAEKGGDGNEDLLMFNDVYEGNYTFNMYNGSSSGDLLQSGWMHSYGSLNTDYGEYFESWSSHTEDTNGDGVANNIFVKYNPDTECNCSVDINVQYNVYDADTGMYIDYGSEDHEINGTEFDNFETDVFYAPKDANYTFDFYLYDTSGDNWNYEDNFSFTVYLECDNQSNYSFCDSDEYFESWSKHTEDTNGDGVANNIFVKYNPDTDCNCSIDIQVAYNAFSNETNDYDYDYYNHNITGTEIDNFTTDVFYPSGDANYTFTFYMYDDDYNYEDNFTFTIYLECDTDDNNSNCDYDEWFEDWDHVTEDNDGDNLDDTIVVNFDPNTECDCEVDIRVYMDVFQNSSGNYVGNEYDEFTINGTQIDSFEIDWTSSNSTSYDFAIYMYDEQGNFEDSFRIYDVYLYQTSGAGGPGDEDEYFDYFYHYIYDADEDGHNDTIDFFYDPDTTCDCNINVTTYFDVYDNGTGEWIDSEKFNHTIYNDDDDDFYHYWEPWYNGTFDFSIKLYDEDGNIEDEEHYAHVELHVRSESNQTGEDVDEWFGDVDHRVDRDLLEIGFNPNTEFEGYTNVSIQINIYRDDGTGMLEDTISALIYSDDYDWIEYNWTAYEAGYYYFELRLFDENNNLEEEYYSDDIFLKGNESDNQAWFDSLTYTVTDADGDEKNDKVFVDYTVKAECEDEMQLLLILDIFDQDLVMIDTFEEYFILQNNEILELSFTWENNHSEEEITFFSVLEYLVDGDTDGEIIVQDSSNTSFYSGVFDRGAAFYIEDVTGRDMVFEGQNIQYEAIIQGSNDVIVDWDMGDGTIYEDALKVYHTYQDSGTYEIAIFVFDENNYAEEYFQINVRNVPPTILNIMMDDTVNEGDQVSFNVQYEDVLMDMDNISVSWIFPDGVFQGNFVQYTFADDGEFLISVEIKDDDGGATMEQRMVTVQNVAPIFTEFALPSEGEQGVAMDFRVSATDPGDDTITYKFDFGDGTAQLITQDGNVSHKFASGDTFEIIICAIDEDGGETCRTEVIPVALLEEIEDSGLPGFGFLGVISALGAITLLRRRTH